MRFPPVFSTVPPKVASVHQLAVDPDFQRELGVGTALLRLAERWASRNGYTMLALDTPEAADHLVDYYHRHGFCIKETVQFAGRPYRSLVFSKSVADHKIANRRPCVLGGYRLITPIQRAQRLNQRLT